MRDLAMEANEKALESLNKESKTGKYKIINGVCIKVSDAVPKIASRIDGVFYPGKSYTEYFNGLNPVEIHSKGQKKAEMAARGLREYPDDDTPCEKAGKIFSYNGQPHKSRLLEQTPKKKVPKHILERVKQKML